MNIQQYLSRVQAPTLPTPILHREALVHLLARYLEQPALTSSTPPKLILLCAPAGYGKTTLLVDTMHQISATCCWYFFESTDTPNLFLKSLLMSIQQGFPEIGNHLTAFSNLDQRANEGVAWETILDQLVETLNSQISQHFVLALCNYHTIQQNKVLNRLIDRLLAHPPLQAVLVIESRSLPNLNLAPLIAHRQMFGIGSNKLRFTAQELYELAHLQGFTTFSWSDAEHLASSFEGWIAGILLGSSLGYTQMHPLAPSHKGHWGELAQLTDRQSLAAYIDEIFRQETITYEFLTAVSILDQLTPAHCNTLLGSTDAAQRLIYAEQQGLFVVRSEQSAKKDDVGVYICPPVLRELFKEKLRVQSFSLYLDMHRKAAYLLYNDQMYEQALTHALQAQEYSLATTILTQIAPDLVIQGKSKIVGHWLDMLPEQILKQDPWILMILINIHLTRNEYAQVPPLLEAVESLLETCSLAQDQKGSLLLYAEMSLARSKLLFYQRDFQQSRELCQEILRLLPEDEIHLRTRTYHRLGVCLVVGLGQIHEGIVQFQQALQLSTSQIDERQTATLYRLLASAYGWIGNYSLADYHQERALSIWEKLHEPWGIANSLTSMGLLKLRQGSTQMAEEILLRALHLAREVYHFRSGEAYALVALGELCCKQGHYVRALAYLEDGLHLARQCEDRYLIHCGLCSIATTYLQIGEIQTSQFFLSQVSLSKQEDSTYEGLLFRLTQGRLSLAQQVYTQARSDLEYAVTLGETTNIRFLHVQALLLLIVCHIRQNELNMALQRVKQVFELNKNNDFAYTLSVEEHSYPELSTVLAQMAQMGQVETLSTGQIFAHQTQPLSTSGGNALASSSSLRIFAFGEPKVLINEVPITHWRMARSQELFFLLLESVRPLSKDKLIDALWPDTTIEQIDTTVRTAIYYLRQIIGKACVVYDSGLYRLDLAAVYGPEIWYDVTLFETHYSQAQKALAVHDDEVTRTALTDLVTLYTGDYLQAFYNNWCIPRRSKLRQIYMDAREQLARLEWRQKRWDASIEQWHHLLSLDPCSESAHYWIMRAYLQQEKRELALRQYQICCQRLQEDLHATPGTAIQELYQRIK